MNNDTTLNHNAYDDLYGLVMQLPLDHRLVVEFFYFQQLELDEIAAINAQSEDVVAGQLVQAEAWLGQQLAPNADPVSRQLLAESRLQAAAATRNPFINAAVRQPVATLEKAMPVRAGRPRLAWGGAVGGAMLAFLVAAAYWLSRPIAEGAPVSAYDLIRDGFGQFVSAIDYRLLLIVAFALVLFACWFAAVRLVRHRVGEWEATG